MKYLDARENLDSMIEDFMRLNYYHVNSDYENNHDKWTKYNAEVCDQAADYLKELKEFRKNKDTSYYIQQWKKLKLFVIDLLIDEKKVESDFDKKEYLREIINEMNRLENNV